MTTDEETPYDCSAPTLSRYPRIIEDHDVLVRLESAQSDEGCCWRLVLRLDRPQNNGAEPLVFYFSDSIKPPSLEGLSDDTWSELQSWVEPFQIRQRHLLTWARYVVYLILPLIHVAFIICMFRLFTAIPSWGICTFTYLSLSISFCLTYEALDRKYQKLKAELELELDNTFKTNVEAQSYYIGVFQERSHMSIFVPTGHWISIRFRHHTLPDAIS